MVQARSKAEKSGMLPVGRKTNPDEAMNPGERLRGGQAKYPPSGADVV
jgi:hypothetical protein